MKNDVIQFLIDVVKINDIAYIHSEMKGEIDNSPFIIDKSVDGNIYHYLFSNQGKKKKVRIKFHDSQIEHVVLVINKVFMNDYDKIIFGKHKLDIDLILDAQLYIHNYKSFN